MQKRLIFIFFIFIFISPLQFTQSKAKGSTNKNPLIGTWQTVRVKMSESYLTLDFKPDKKFKYLLQSQWFGGYRFNGTELISSYRIPFLNKIVTDTSVALIISDTLITKVNSKGKSKTTKFVRVNENSKRNGIIGKWHTYDYNGHEAIIEYEPKGGLKITEILRKFDGYYIVKGDHFDVFAENGGKMMDNMRFQMLRDEMIIYGKKPHSTMKFNKIK